jgi:hypothetical protein
MTGDRERMAPEMTPFVDPMDKTLPAEGRQPDEVDERPDLEPGQVPGPGTNLDGASRYGMPDERLPGEGGATGERP